MLGCLIYKSIYYIYIFVYLSIYCVQELDKCWAVFISNKKRVVPLWKQKVGQISPSTIIPLHVKLWNYVNEKVNTTGSEYYTIKILLQSS